ncbi:MAG: DUF2752 domain-containing protein [Balneolaceae bacterium]|nr:MAG: DUF2752 domain-containing protein [Balneolaceae bacterium]
MIKNMDSFRKYFFLHFEWIILSLGLLLIAVHNPYGSSESFCIAGRFGFSFCPGCGLGTSVALLFRGELSDSIVAHPAGLPAVLIICSRILAILKRNLTMNKEESA